MFSIRMYCGGTVYILFQTWFSLGMETESSKMCCFLSFTWILRCLCFEANWLFCWRVDLNHFLMLQSSIWVKGIQAVNGPRNKQVSSSHSGPSTQVVLFGGDKLWGQKIWYPKCPQVGPLGVRRGHILFSCHLRVKMNYIDLNGI